MRLQDLFDDIVASHNDQPPPAADPRRIIICTTPRTAGHSVCQFLRQAGLGMPTEYFQWQFALPLMKRWSAEDNMDVAALQRRAPEYGRHLLQKRSAGGIFAAKIFNENFDFMRRSIGDDDPGWTYVFLTRRNKTAQTVSLLSMLLTGRPSGDEGVMAGVARIGKITRQAVDNAALYISANEADWKMKLREIDKERVSTVAYEDFVSDPANTMAAAMGNWFPQVDFQRVQGLGAGRYRSDRDIKVAIEDEFGAYIDRFWRSGA